MSSTTNPSLQDKSLPLRFTRISRFTSSPRRTSPAPTTPTFFRWWRVRWTRWSLSNLSTTSTGPHWHRPPYPVKASPTNSWLTSDSPTPAANTPTCRTSRLPSLAKPVLPTPTAQRLRLRISSSTVTLRRNSSETTTAQELSVLSTSRSTFLRPSRRVRAESSTPPL